MVRLDIAKLKAEQISLAKKVICRDEFDKVKLVGGVDQAFVGDEIISTIVVCDYKTMEQVEEKHAVVKATAPYIPGYMAYREAPAIVEAYGKLEKKPDVLIVEGNGILHPRRIGMASHVGIVLDIPTIGIVKNLLLGEVIDREIMVGNEVRGFELMTKEHAKPVYVSIGHKITLGSSVRIVKECMVYPHKLPEPVHLAHKKANELREQLDRKIE
ncbi:endonuclease V [Candidatus Woesearchaeota archaeon]|nr:endonuclease V [Candidatus Woesearchaeota archaeon]